MAGGFRSSGGLLVAAVLLVTGCDDGEEVEVQPCAPGCPTGYSCTDGNTCTGGAPQELQLDLKVVEFEGTLTRDGAPILDTSCSRVISNGGTYGPRTTPSNSILELNGNGTQYYVNVSCSQEGGWTFHGWVPPGSYQVTFRPESQSSQKGSRSNVGTFSLKGDQKGLVINVDSTRLGAGGAVAPLPSTAAHGKVSSAQESSVDVAGTLSRNGQPLGQLTDCGHYTRERALPNEPSPIVDKLVPPNIVFVDEGGLSTRMPLTCGNSMSGSGAWTFSGKVTPGIYRVELELDYRATVGFDVQATSSVLGRVPGPIHVLSERLQLP